MQPPNPKDNNSSCDNISYTLVNDTFEENSYSLSSFPPEADKIHIFLRLHCFGQKEHSSFWKFARANSIEFAHLRDVFCDFIYDLLIDKAK